MLEQPQQIQPNNQGQGPARQIRSRGVAQLTWRIIVFLIAFLVPMLILTGLVVFFAYSWGVIIWSDYYLFLCGIPGLWFIVSWIIAANAHVVLDNQRLVVFRMGKSRNKALGPGPVLLIPFLDEIVSIVDRRQITRRVQFNRVPIRNTAGEGFILCNPELQLFITYLAGQEHLSVVEVRDIVAQIEAQAGGSVQAVTRNYDVNEARDRSPQLIADIEDAINEHAEAWGVDIRVEISDWHFPPQLEEAWTLSEQAETGVAAQKIEAEARRIIVQGYIAAAEEFLDEGATRTQIGQVALALYKYDVAKSFAGKSGAIPILQLQDFLKAQE